MPQSAIPRAYKSLSASSYSSLLICSNSLRALRAQEDTIEKGFPELTVPIYLLRTKKTSSENDENKQKEFQTETFRSVFYRKFHNFLGKKKVDFWDRLIVLPPLIDHIHY